MESMLRTGFIAFRLARLSLKEPRMAFTRH